MAMASGPVPEGGEHIKKSGSALHMLQKGFHDFIVDTARVGKSKAGNTCLYLGLLETSKTSDAGKVVKDFLLHPDRLQEFSSAVGVDCMTLEGLDCSLLPDLPVRAYVIHQPWNDSLVCRVSRYARHPLQGQRQSSDVLQWAQPNPIPELAGDGCL